ncbi:nucleolin-like [Anneissia japonica]|uniref:nucleolin-like n=1 Tax=Anneissia japonica TaxID=1529436 RepID=UPI001425620F|nr:nucleolin-like [Anneissia japonica]
MSGTTEGLSDVNNDGNDNSRLIAILCACAVIFSLILITAIAALSYYVCKKKRELESMESKLGDLDDVDRIMWAEMGRKDDVVTENPAFGKEDPADFEPLDVTGIEKEFDDEYEEESESEEKEKQNGEDGEDKKPKSSRLSILDANTWSGMPNKKKKAPRKQIPRTVSRLENDPQIRNEIASKFENPTTLNFDYTLFNLNSGPNQRTVNNYEVGKGVVDDIEEGVPPPHIPSAGNRLLWQKKRFKDV